jgi:NCS1 family nucleobase:cation symporter-1
MQLDQAGLYKHDGPYWYRGGFNPRAIVALVLGIGVCLPGLLVHLGVLAVDGRAGIGNVAMTIPPFFAQVYNYAWFASFAVSFGVYVLLMWSKRGKMSRVDSEGRPI